MRKVQDSIQRKRLAKKKWDMDRTEENRQEYKELQRRVKREVSKAKQKAYEELYTRLDTREGEKDLYRLARQRDRDGKDVQQVRVIKDRDGRVLTSEESVQRRWKEYFEELMNEENEREKKSRRGELCGTENLEKAYDRVPREELWYCMRKSGVAEKYVRVVQDMYERSRTVVRCAVGQTEEFNVEVGLHQGSALTPFLFAIVMDQLSEEVRQESPWTMMFADDIVICSESREQVEENLERWKFALERRGMKVSRSKTEYMCVNEREGSGTVRLQGEEVKKVQEFKYLGSTVQSNGECGKEVKKRVQAGWNGWRKVSGVLCDQKISARIKGKVYRTVVRGAMLYGLETVSLRKRQESELEVFEDDDAADVQEALPTFVLNIFVVTRARDGVLHKQAGIAVEGTEVHFGIPDVARACASLMGLICTLELSYPKKLKYTFEVFEDDDAADVQEALPTFVLNIFVVTRARDGVLHKQAGIAVEGTEVHFGIPDVARACASLMGLICTLELSYPKKLKYTFEVFEDDDAADVQEALPTFVLNIFVVTRARDGVLHKQAGIAVEGKGGFQVFEDDDAADVQEALPTFVLNIFVVTRARDGVLHKQAGIAVEGTEVHFGIPDVARACAFSGKRRLLRPAQEALPTFVLNIFVVTRARDGVLHKQAGIAVEGTEVFEDDDAADVQEALPTFVLNIFVVTRARDGVLHKQAGIAVEGTETEELVEGYQGTGHTSDIAPSQRPARTRRGSAIEDGRRPGGSVSLRRFFEDDDAADVQEALPTFVLNIFVVTRARDGVLHKQAGIAVEGER
ncbi:hypothetical protein QTP70_012153, partial [Hemibagrus guttatus]